MGHVIPRPFNNEVSTYQIKQTNNIEVLTVYLVCMLLICCSLYFLLHDLFVFVSFYCSILDCHILC